ncbi:hypothetical protein [Deinococcus rufus]|uniref:Uncharacterized protein n=1 Tax=Deinococcus rufus TaxID=2136097 RepID=A0ABV7ZAX5_9DEIO
MSGFRSARHLMNLNEAARRVLREPALLAMNDRRGWLALGGAS